MKLFFILFSLLIPALGVAQKNVVVATSADPGHLNPGITTGYNVHVFADSIYSGLVMLDRSLQPSPDLAESWRVEEDMRIYIDTSSLQRETVRTRRRRSRQKPSDHENVHSVCVS